MVATKRKKDTSEEKLLAAFSGVYMQEYAAITKNGELIKDGVRVNVQKLFEDIYINLGADQSANILRQTASKLGISDKQADFFFGLMITKLSRIIQSPKKKTTTKGKTLYAKNPFAAWVGQIGNAIIAKKILQSKTGYEGELELASDVCVALLMYATNPSYRFPSIDAFFTTEETNREKLKELIVSAGTSIGAKEFDRVYALYARGTVQ